MTDANLSGTTHWRASAARRQVPKNTRSLQATEQALRAELKKLGRCVIALSGGVDSSLVAALAQAELGDNALAVTGISASLPSDEAREVEAFCQARGIRHETLNTDELSLPEYVENTPARCYHCKGELYGQLRALADARGIEAVLDGTHLDDLGAHRPSLQAADEHRVRSPLVELGLDKAQVRALAKALGLPNHDRPANPCLSSRIAYGVSVTPLRLSRVEAAERALKALGFSRCRVRLHDEVARIEVPRSDLGRAIEQASELSAAVKAAGFVWATLDLDGLRSGSLLEVIGSPK